MNSLNSKLLYLPLKELQMYLNSLEVENEKLKCELTTISRFNCILENIRRSSNKGFDAMQLIDRNKSCVCNEPLNGQLRRMAHEADIELRVWQEQYDKLVLKTKQDYMATFEEETRSISHSPRSSPGSSSPRSPSSPTHSLESEPETTRMSLSSNHTNDSNYRNRSPVLTSRAGSISLDNDSGYRSNLSFTDNSNQNPTKNADKRHAINDEAVIRYITNSPVEESAESARSTPVVVYDSKKDSKLVCDWPNCNRVFSNEDILTHHRRNHIRKSIYSCEFCSTRLLSKEELDNHMRSHRIKPEIEELDEEPELIVDEDRHDAMRVDNTVQPNTSEAVNLSNKSVGSPNHAIPPLNPLTNIQFTTDKVDKNPLNFQSALFQRLSAPQTPTSIPSVVTKSIPLVPIERNLNNNLKVNPKTIADEYKRTRYSGVGRYRCPWPDCGYTPHFLRDLRRHMFKHTGDKKHKCDYPGCDFVSVWKTSLLQHQRKKHFVVNNNINSNNSLYNKIAV